MSIANRALLGFVTLSLLAIALGLWSLDQFETVRNASRLVATRDGSIVRQVTEMRSAQAEMRDARERLVLAYLGSRVAPGAVPAVPDPATAADWRRASGRLSTVLDEAVAAAQGFGAQAIAPERRAAWAAVVTALNGTAATLARQRERVETQVRLLAADDAAPVVAAEPAVIAGAAELDRGLDRAEAAMERLSAIGQQRVDEIADNARNLILLGLGAAVLIAVGVTALVRRAIARPLEGVLDFVERIGRGRPFRRPGAGGARRVRAAGRDAERHGGGPARPRPPEPGRHRATSTPRRPRSAPPRSSRPRASRSSSRPCRRRRRRWTRSPIPAPRSASARRR